MIVPTASRQRRRTGGDCTHSLKTKAADRDGDCTHRIKTKAADRDCDCTHSPKTKAADRDCDCTHSLKTKAADRDGDCTHSPKTKAADRDCDCTHSLKTKAADRSHCHGCPAAVLAAAQRGLEAAVGGTVHNRNTHNCLGLTCHARTERRLVFTATVSVGLIIQLHQDLLEVSFSF